VYPGPKRFPADHNSNFPYTKAVKTETMQGITKEKQHEAKKPGIMEVTKLSARREELML
jgi:hypothetical protein